MKQIPRSLAAVLIAVLAASSASAAPAVHPRPYGRGMAYYHKTPVPQYTLQNTTLKLSFDFQKGLVYGDATNVVVPKGELGTIAFNSVGLKYSAVSVNGKPVKYRVDDNHLYVDLAQPANAADPISIEAKYTAHPTRGIYFIRPDKHYPHMQPEIWSQGEEEDNRMWFPTWDEPNDKTPVEEIVTVPKGWTVIGNGHLKARTDGASTTTWDWVEPAPISTYLIAFSAGPYVKFHTALKRADGSELPVDYFASQADAKWAPTCFGRTKDIVAYFEKIIGVPFPWEKEDQTAVERFTAGGMENASTTTQTEFAIHPPQYDLEQPCDGLVAHELAHQWWGDDVTTPDWPNIWINEGYATYFEELWAQHHFGEAEFEYQRYHAQQEYFDETKLYYRPIVDYDYAEAGDSFDASGYPRPGQVLHMLRYMYGDQKFFGALKTYLTQYQHKNADTHQFFAAIDGALGANLDWFQQEWFYRAAYPHFYVKDSYDAKNHTLTLDVRQRNHDGKPFRMPVVVSVYSGGHGKNARFIADANHQIVHIAGVTAKPQMVLFDPNNNIIRKLTYTKTVNELGYQALHAPYVADRLWAIEQLGNASKADKALARQFVRDAVLHDPFYGVRTDALNAAANLGDAATITAAMRDSDPRVVIAAARSVEGLDNAGDTALVAQLKSLTKSSNALVAGAALRGLGATKAKGVYPILVAGLNRHAFREPIARGALAGLANYGDPRALPLLKARTAYGVDESERTDAIAAYAKLGKKQPKAVEPTLLAIAQHDPYFRARNAAVRALGTLHDRSVIPALKHVEASDTEQGVQNAAWDAVHTIEVSGKAK